MTRNLGLDLLRGLCACAVTAYHFMYWRDGYLLTSMGTFGVYVFFILSSLAMMMRYGGEFSGKITALQLKAFYVARIARVLPLLAAVSVIAYYYYGQGLGLFEKTVLTATGLMFMGLPGSHSIATGAWSLGIELAFYAVFPVVAVLAPGIGTLILVTGLLMFCQQLGLSLISYGDAATWTAYTVPLTFAPYFALGIVAYQLKFGPRVVFLCAGLAVLALVLFFSLAKAIDVYSGGKTYIALMMLSSVAVLLFFNSVVPSPLQRVSRFLGDISYSLYLTHWISYDLAMSLSRALGAPTRAEPILFAALALGIAYSTFRLFEMPAQQIIKRLCMPSVPSANGLGSPAGTSC